jgi:hypothetical protein
MRADIRGIGLANRCSHCASPTDMFNDLRLCEELFHTACGNAYADFITDCHRETWPVRSKRFRNVIAALLLPSNRGRAGRGGAQLGAGFTRQEVLVVKTSTDTR